MKRKFSPLHFYLKIILNTSIILITVVLITVNRDVLQKLGQDSPWIMALFFLPGVLITILWMRKRRTR